MGRGCAFKGLFVLTFVSLFCSSVYAEITQKSADGDKYRAGGFKYVTSSCDTRGIAADYANIGFIKGFLPADKQDGLKKVSWDPKSKKMFVEAKENYTLACNEEKLEQSVSLSCRFDPLPKGVNYLWFKITRTKEGANCSETALSEGQFSGLVRLKGYTPEGLHTQVANAFTAPYGGSNGRAIAGKKHTKAAASTLQQATTVTTK